MLDTTYSRLTGLVELFPLPQGYTELQQMLKDAERFTFMEREYIIIEIQIDRHFDIRLTVQSVESLDMTTRPQ